MEKKKSINDDDYDNDDDDDDDDDAKIKQLGKALDLSPSPVNEVSTLPPLHPDFFSGPRK